MRLGHIQTAKLAPPAEVFETLTLHLNSNGSCAGSFLSLWHWLYKILHISVFASMHLSAFHRMLPTNHSDLHVNQ